MIAIPAVDPIPLDIIPYLLSLGFWVHDPWLAGTGLSFSLDCFWWTDLSCFFRDGEGWRVVSYVVVAFRSMTIVVLWVSHFLIPVVAMKCWRVLFRVCHLPSALVFSACVSCVFDTDHQERCFYALPVRPPTAPSRQTVSHDLITITALLDGPLPNLPSMYVLLFSLSIMNSLSPKAEHELSPHTVALPHPENLIVVPFSHTLQRFAWWIFQMRDRQVYAQRAKESSGVWVSLFASTRCDN